jgi:hypothetical protein
MWGWRAAVNRLGNEASLLKRSRAMALDGGRKGTEPVYITTVWAGCPGDDGGAFKAAAIGWAGLAPAKIAARDAAFGLPGKMLDARAPG